MNITWSTPSKDTKRKSSTFFFWKEKLNDFRIIWRTETVKIRKKEINMIKQTELQKLYIMCPKYFRLSFVLLTAVLFLTHWLDFTEFIARILLSYPTMICYQLTILPVQCYKLAFFEHITTFIVFYCLCPEWNIKYL